MMNKTSIDWCDFTWNPVTGCRRGCPYCYARAMARRFTGDIRINLADPQIVAQDGPEGKVYTLAAPFKNAARPSFSLRDLSPPSTNTAWRTSAQRKSPPPFSSAAWPTCSRPASRTNGSTAFSRRPRRRRDTITCF